MTVIKGVAAVVEDLGRGLMATLCASGRMCARWRLRVSSACESSVVFIAILVLWFLFSKIALFKIMFLQNPKKPMSTSRPFSLNSETTFLKSRIL